ncbi:MAG: hypothetical protein J6D34_08405 [Atopobiaceae bacterium]|nr:hypothetical protein [Atopobiaceae bacterium]
MTADGKILKVTSIIALFAGIASIVLGFVLLMPSFVDPDACITALEGLVSIVYGVRTAIMANVPSNTAKIRTKALILMLLAAVVVGVFYFAGLDVTMYQIVMAVCICVIAVAGFAMASKIVKEQLRK